MLFRKSYYFNEQTFTYEPIRLTKDLILRQIGKASIVGLVFAVVYLMGCMLWWGDPEQRNLARAQAELQTELTAQYAELSLIENRIDKLHEKDNSFYRSILSTDRLDAALWNAGLGGAAVSNAQLEPVRNVQEMIARLEHKMGVCDHSFGQLMTLAVAKKAELRRMPAIRPCGGRFLSGFGYRANPFHGGSEFHQGIDFAAPIGTPVYATGDGVVITADDRESGYGNQIEINHGSGYVTKYAHLSAYRVQVGDSVARGQLIGLIGNTGYSTGPHLHYEVIRNGVKINPIDFFYNN
jgi:murein DD-endopeptidase MepM/ murein hydrolase activator NlpD